MHGGEPDLDVMIVGAGISGISLAAHMAMINPAMRYALIERRAQAGGTWDLFRYPGVRSDSDMHTLGFRFAPWADDRSIAGGEDIRAYLERVIDDYRIAEHTRFATRVVSADWHAAAARWRVLLEGPDGTCEVTARWLHLATGYYDYDAAHDAQLPGLERFAGTVAHPQFWPEQLDYTGKRVVVIGSGATAVTLVPAMAEHALHVTMLQRTPTWMIAHPSRDPWARRIRRWLGEARGGRLIRFINVRLHALFFTRSRREPEKVAAYLRTKLKGRLGDHYRTELFEPPYGPWNQRLCLLPDGDLLEAVKAGRVSVVTATIGGFEPDAIVLDSGVRLAADVIVTATGLKLQLGGHIAVTRDSVPVDWREHWFYRGAMFSNLPNLSVTFGYLNNSWTLRADNTADYVCRVLQHMAEVGADTATPELPRDHGLEQADIVLLSSGYLQRARTLMPKSGPALPWRLNMDYLEDCRHFRQVPVADGVLRFARLPQASAA